MENTTVNLTAQNISASLGCAGAKQGKMAAVRAISDYIHGFNTAQEFDAVVGHVQVALASPTIPAVQQEFSEAFLRTVENFLELD